MTLIWIMMVFSTLVVVDSPPAGTRSPVDHGYFLENGLQDCPSTCETCESNTTCTLCKKTYYGPACQFKCDCNEEGCNKETGVCAPGCVDGWWGEDCELQCPDCVCKKCDNNSGQCLHCHDNYFLHDGKCKICPHGCSLCVNDSKCTECQESYFLLDGRCESCMQGCQLCNTSNNCILCNNESVPLFHDLCLVRCPANTTKPTKLANLPDSHHNISTCEEHSYSYNYTESSFCQTQSNDFPFAEFKCIYQCNKSYDSILRERTCIIHDLSWNQDKNTGIETNESRGAEWRTVCLVLLVLFLIVIVGIAVFFRRKYPISKLIQSIRQWIRQKRTQRSCENNHSENHGKTEEGHRKCPLDGDSLKSKGFCRETKQANKETLKNEHKFELNENGTSCCVRIETESKKNQENAEVSHSSDDIVCNGEDPNNSILKLTGTEHLPVSHRPQSPSDNERLENPETTRSNKGSQFFPENEPLLPKHNLRGPDSMPFQATRLCTSLSKEELHTSSNSIHKQESICPSDKSDNLEANKPLDASPKEGVLSKLKQDKTDQQMLQKEEGYILSVTKSNQQSTGTAQSTEIAQPTTMMSQPLIEDRRLTTSGTDCPASVDINNERKQTKLGETQTLRKNSLENANKIIPWPPDKNPPEKKIMGHQVTHI